MTSQIFEEEVRKWEAELKSRKILLLVDNCPAHPIISYLRNIELAFFPANTTSILQPQNQSVIKSLKESPPTIQQALDAAKLVENFLLFNQDDSTTYLDMNRIHKIIQNKYWHSKKRQTKLSDYMCKQ